VKLFAILLTAMFFLGNSMSDSDSAARAGGGHSNSNQTTGTAPQAFPAALLGPRTPISPPNVGYHGGVEVVADPESEKNLIVCGYRANQQTGTYYEGYVYQSGDGGETWREVLVDAESQWVSEQSCAFGPAHQAFFAAGVSDTSRGKPRHEYGNLHLYRSLDGGQRWRIIHIDRFMDFTSMTVDVTHGIRRNTVYLFANAVIDGMTGRRWTVETPYLATFREIPNLSFSVTSGRFNSDQASLKVPGKYPQASTVLSDGTALAVFSGEKEISDGWSRTTLFSVELGTSRDGGKTLDKAVIYEDVDPLIASGLAVNEAKGEIYIAWTAGSRNHAENKLMLASSRDKGCTWAVKSVRQPQNRALDLRAGTLSLAANKDGVLGFMWYGTDARRVYFGASFDAGNSLSGVVQLTPEPLPCSWHGVLLADDRRLVVSPPSWNASSHSLEPLKIFTLGTNAFGYSSGNALVADRTGVFHPVWSEVANGTTHLWTRAVSMGVTIESKRLPNIDGLTDISERIVAHISLARYDHLDHLLAFDLAVTNKAETTIQAPVLIEAGRPSGWLELSAENADNGKSGEGALWELDIPLGGLRCEQETQHRTLTFRINKRTGHTSAEYSGLDIPVRIFGRLR